MNHKAHEIASWITKLSELEVDRPDDACDLLIKEKDYALQAFRDGIRTYDLEPLIIRILLETGHSKEALSFIEGNDEFNRSITKNSFFSVLESVFSSIYTEPSWNEIARDLIDITRRDKHWSYMTLGLEVDLALYGNQEEYTLALEKIDSILKQPPALSFDSRYDADIVAFKACVAAASRQDFENAGKYMQIMLKANPTTMTKLNAELKSNERIQDFKKSHFFKQTAPLQPKEKFLQSAYDNAEDEPFKVYQTLEKKRDTANDLADLVSVQHYCISLICSDLEEHGEGNLEEYGKGKVSIKEFKQLKKDLENELKDLMKELKLKETIFWKFKNFKSFKDIPF